MLCVLSGVYNYNAENAEIMGEGGGYKIRHSIEHWPICYLQFLDVDKFRNGTAFPISLAISSKKHFLL